MTRFRRATRPPGSRRASQRRRVWSQAALPSGRGTSGTGQGVARWSLAALALLLVGGMLLVVNLHHSGDPLKIRRELRKF